MLSIQTPVAQIVLDHSECASVLQRHRIDFCCKGHVPLQTACADRGADPQAVLADLERAVAQRSGAPSLDPRNAPTAELVNHIVEQHHRYLRDALPFLVPLAQKVARVHGAHNSKLLDLRDTVLELADALEPHLDREEQVLFPALIGARELAPGVVDELRNMEREHLEVAELLERMRQAMDDFSVPDWACTSYRTLFRELQTLDGDVRTHMHLENHALRPRFVVA